MITTKSEDIVVNVKNNPIKNGTWQKLLGVKIDYKLTFKFYIDEIYEKAGQKMNVLSRIMAYMNIKKRRTLSNAFFISQFNLICQSRAKNNKTNRLHERCLSIIYNDKISLFKQLLEKDGSVSIHIKNLWFRVVEMFKVVKGLAPKIFSDLFPLREQNKYSLRQKSFVYLGI